MSSALADVGGTDQPDLDETIRRTVKALKSGREADAGDIARYIGISRSSLYNRLNGAAPFLASEVGKIARYFRVPVGDLYDGIVRIGPTVVTDARTGKYPSPSGPKTRRLSLVRDLPGCTQTCAARYGSSPTGSGRTDGTRVHASAGTVNNADAA